MVADILCTGFALAIVFVLLVVGAMAASRSARKYDLSQQLGRLNQDIDRLEAKLSRIANDLNHRVRVLEGVPTIPEAPSETEQPALAAEQPPAASAPAQPVPVITPQAPL